MALALSRRKFTVEDYHAMAQAGILAEDDRVELIRGEIVDMSPIGIRHAVCVKRLTALLTELLGRRAIVSVQDPLEVDQETEVQPDIVLLKFRADYYESQAPTSGDALLVVEVSDTTLAFDRRVRVPLYAQAGISDVWLVNLQQGTIEVYAQPSEGAYLRVQRARRGQQIPVPGFEDLYVSVDKVLGEQVDK